MSTGPDGPQAGLKGANYLPNDALGSLLCITGPIFLIDPVSRYKKSRKLIVVLGTLVIPCIRLGVQALTDPRPGS